MKAFTLISHAFLAMLVLTAFMFNGLPGKGACQTDSGHGSDEVIADAHCLCAHGMEASRIPLSLVSGMAECETGCACVPNRSQWQNPVPGRIQSDHRGKEGVTFDKWVATFGHPSSIPHIGHIPRPGLAPQPLDPILQSLRTIVLLA